MRFVRKIEPGCLASLIAEKKTIQEIARDLGVHPDTVQRSVKKFGLPQPPRSRKAQPEQLLAAIQQAKTAKQIAAELNVGTSTVYQAIKRYGLPKARHVSPPRVAPWCPPHHWPTYMALTGKRLTKDERRAIVEQDIARERRA